MEKQKSLQEKMVIKNNKIVEFKGKLTTGELKLFSLIMANVHEGDVSEKALEEFKIDVSELEAGAKGHDFHGHLREIAFSLESKHIEMDYIENGHRKSIRTRLIYRPVVSGTEKTMEFQLDKLIIPYILQFKEQGYTKYQFINILKMRSSYSIRIYELIKQYQSFKDGTREFLLEDLRNILGLLETEYSTFAEFNRRVLKKAKDEINEHTDIEIDYEFERKGRKVRKIKVLVLKSRCVLEKVKEDTIHKMYDIKEIERKMGLARESFSPKMILNLYTAACEKANGCVDEYRYSVLNYTWMLTQDETIRNRYGYLLKALKDDLGRAYPTLKLENRLMEKDK